MQDASVNQPKQEGPTAKKEGGASSVPIKKKVIGFVCERSVDLEKMMTEQETLKGDPNVHLIPVPCSGMIRPMAMERALKLGAAKVFACGCKIGDCHYRNGNLMIRDRLSRDRAPKLKKQTPDEKIGAFFYSKVDNDEFANAVKEFVDRPDTPKTGSTPEAKPQW